MARKKSAVKITNKGSRKAIFTFDYQGNFELDSDQFDAVLSQFGFKSEAEFQKFIPKSGSRDAESENKYRVIDKKLLPLLQFAVFFDNFYEPKKLFSNPKAFHLEMNSSDLRLKGARVVYLALWESDVSEKLKLLEIAVEVGLVLDVVDGVDVENPDIYDGEDLEGTFRECCNMFTFSIKDVEGDMDDDEVLSHGWSARFC